MLPTLPPPLRMLMTSLLGGMFRSGEGEGLKAADIFSSDVACWLLVL